MAASELEIEPDLNKAPPHVEGDLLKQNSKSIVGRKKGWRKYFFIVLRDKLQYFRRREDYKQNKEPISFIRMSQVIEITEIVFSGVPKKHHLNCGFSIIAFHPTTQQQQSINLLAETPEDMRYWVHALRYIKAYWSKMQVRETVLSEEQERKLLERLFREEEDERDLLVGEYSLGDDGSISTPEERNVPLTVYFADGSKVKLNLLPSDTTSDLLDHERVKDKLTSSAAQLWFIDCRGNDQLLDPKDCPAFYQPKAHKFFALNPSHVVLVVFFARSQQFECMPVSSNITAKEVINHHLLSVQLDISGVTNRGLFLKSDEEEQLFNSTECPCEVLFGVDENGMIVRQPVGHLLIKNKALGGARRTQKPRFKTTFRSYRSVSDEEKLMERISEEEEAQSKALDLLIKKKLPASAENRASTFVDGDWVVANSPSDKTTPKMTPSEEPKANVKQPPAFVEKVGIDSRGFEDSVEVEVARTGRTDRAASLPTVHVARPRSSPVLGTNSPISARRKSPGADAVPSQRQKRGSPSESLPTVSPERRSRSRSPRRLPDLPTADQSNESLRRRNATRRGTISEERTVRNSKGPTIVVLSDVRDTPQLSPPATRTRSTSVRKAFVNGLHADNSRSSAFGVTSPPQTNITPEITPKPLPNYSGKRSPLGESEEDRLEKLLSRSYQQEAEEESIRNFKPADTLTDKYHAVLGERREERGRKDSGRDKHQEVSHPMVIDFTQLVARQPSPLPPDVSTAAPSRLSAPIEVHSPSLLKVVLLQSLEASTGTIESKPMDFISLSGVCLRNDHGVWRMQEGCNFHDPLAFDCEDHTETFPLPGGIRAVYNHTHKRWHVLPAPSSTPSLDESRSEVDSIEHTHSLEDRDGSEATLYVTKKAIVAEISSAFHNVMQQFECTRLVKEKKRIGSDMTNVAIGHMIRGRFCSALARLILDGLKPYRMEGLVVDDIWRVTVAFCNEAQGSHEAPLVFAAFDKQILQPIGSLKPLKDNNMKFRTFICLAMSKGMLCDWLEALPKQKDTLRKYYLPTGFLPLASKVETFSQLYQQVMLILEPIIHLPFDLSIDFEIKQVEQQAKQAETQEEQSPSSPSSQQQTNQMQRSVSPQPLRTVVKIHAATGQKTTAGNVLTAVWQRPIDVKGEPADRDETDTKEFRSSLQALKDIQERHQAAASHQPPTPHQPPAPHQPPISHQPPTPHQPPISHQPPATGEKKSWFKKLATSLQQINAGGAITGPPRPTPQQRRQTPNKAYERRVEALYNNIAEDADELSFTKGDVMAVKEQINEEWLICVHGNQTGIVPMNYVKVVP